VISSGDSGSDCKIISPPYLDTRKRGQQLEVEQVVNRKLFKTGDNINGGTSFMSQLGPTPRGTALRTDISANTVVETSTGSVIVTQQATVPSAYKQFAKYTQTGWSTFIKQFRDESARLPKASRRQLCDRPAGRHARLRFHDLTDHDSSKSKV
jgi:hypothetical protein